LELILVRPSLLRRESTVKDLIEKAGGERGGERELEDTSELAGDIGGDKEQSLELELQDLKLRSRGASVSEGSSDLTGKMLAWFIWNCCMRK